MNMFKKFHVAELLVCIFLTTSAISFAQPPAASQSSTPLKFGGRVMEYDIKHLVIDLAFDWKLKRASGTTTIILKMIKPLDVIHFDAGKLDVSKISSGDAKALKFIYDGGDADNGLAVHLGRTATPGEEITLKIYYHTKHVNEPDPNSLGGSFGKGLRFFEPTTASPLKRKQIWSCGEPQSNRYWFPSFDDLGDDRTAEVIVTVEKPLMAISNGELQSIKDNGNGTRTFHYNTSVPYPNYLTTLVVGEYDAVEQKHGKTPILTYGYPDEKDAVIATVERLPEMMDFFQKLTGTAYPFSHFAQVAVQDYPFPGLVGQRSMVIISDNYIDDHRTHADFYYLWDGIAAQGLASQWFGNLIHPESWKDFWLNEAFIHYLDGRFTEFKNGKDEYITYYLPWDKQLVMNDWNSNVRRPLVTKEISDLTLYTSDNFGKTRGALVLRMLQEELGDEVWTDAIKKYVSEYSNRKVTTELFKRSVESSSGRDLSKFFEQWVYGIGHPIFEVSEEYDPVNKELQVSLQQIQQKDTNSAFPQVDYFSGHMEISLGGVYRSIGIEAKEKNVFTFNLENRPAYVYFDVNNTWIKEINYKPAVEQLLAQLKNEKSSAAQRDAIMSLVSIAKDSTTGESLRLNITTALSEFIAGDAYWRVRNFAMSQLMSLIKLPYPEKIEKLLTRVAVCEFPWMRTSAISFLGNGRKKEFAPLYYESLKDSSERVINAAANALGKCGDENAFNALVKLKDQPSWKSQSLISALNGLKELGDPRGATVALDALGNNKLPRWWLAVPVWDYPIAAAETIVALGKQEEGYKIVAPGMKAALHGNDLNDIFMNLMLVSILATKDAQTIYDELKLKYKNNETLLNAVNYFENMYKENLK